MGLVNCPSPDQLLAFSTGELSCETFEEVAQHLKGCADCQTGLHSLPPGQDPWVAALRRLPPADPFQEEPQCLEAVARFEAITLVEARADESLGLEQLGRYQLLGKLGHGGMGQVYLARHVLLKQLVALKVLPPERLKDPQAVARFYREIEAVGRLQHPNIVAARDAGEADGVHYLTMELVDGADLAKLLEQLGPLPIPDACELVRQAAVGLQHAHEHRLVHRDVKPSNLMLAADGQVKVLDLGLARLVPDEAAPGHERTPSAWIVGTWDYLAPEAVTGGREVDGRSDLYGLGCTLYKLLTGRVPFSKATYDTPLKRVLARLQDPVPPVRQYRPEVPEQLATLVHRLLARDPRERFASAAEVAEALRPFSAGCDLPALLARAEPNLSDLPPLESRDTQSVDLEAATTQEQPAPPRPSTLAGLIGDLFVSTGPYLRQQWRRIGRPRLAVAALVIGIAALAGFLWSLERKPRLDQAKGDPAAPLTIRALRVQHFADRGDGEIGVRSFSTRFGDQVRVDAELSEPAHCYLLALNPNGQIQRCWPTDDGTPPDRRGQISYPEEAGMAFDLNDEEGGGLQAFALLAARRPLPAFTQWRKQVPNLGWQRLSARPGVVWRGDGEKLDPVFPGRDVQRGTISDLPGVGPLAEVARQLRTAPGIDAVAVCAFPVARKHDRSYERLMEGEDKKQTRNGRK